MGSRLTQLAEEMLWRHRQPRVLDYEAPPPAESSQWKYCVSDAVEWLGGRSCAAVLVVSGAMVLIGMCGLFNVLGVVIGWLGTFAFTFGLRARQWRELE